MIFNINSIGLLDSGVGGLTVVKEINKILPNERMIYFGDTAKMPYGPREPKQVRGFAMDIINFLNTQDVKMMVVACNTATAVGLDYYQQKFDIPIIGVIAPGAQAAIKATVNRKIGVIGTEGTINSGSYEQALKDIDPDVEVFSKACPLFVLLVENNLMDTKEAKEVAQSYLQPLKNQGVDTLILGCTHYPIMEELIQEVMGPDVKLVNSAKATAQLTKDILTQNKLLYDERRRPVHRYFVSGATAGFERIADNWLGDNTKAFRVDLEN
ncbi:glutamate racemase [Proteinivorax hydrogeniformans]|uniref:Glutamate racemase n=1 Tax=Proteinivorax hydrogeniformans TaxID=1826727 RepID=A0AAU8HWE3_9FIRM